MYQIYNICFASAPVIFFCLYDFEYLKDYEKDVGILQNQKYFMRNPELYAIGTKY